MRRSVLKKRVDQLNREEVVRLMDLMESKKELDDVEMYIEGEKVYIEKKC